MPEYDSRNAHIMAAADRVRARVMFRAVLVFKQYIKRAGIQCDTGHSM